MSHSVGARKIQIASGDVAIMQLGKNEQSWTLVSLVCSNLAKLDMVW